MTTYTVPFEITPDGMYCGKCEGWGRESAKPDQCIVFNQKIRFFGADPGCAAHGYRRCEACIDWEKGHLSATALTMEALQRRVEAMRRHPTAI